MKICILSRLGSAGTRFMYENMCSEASGALWERVSYLKTHVLTVWEPVLYVKIHVLSRLGTSEDAF